EAAMAFDTERLRMALGWTGGFLKLPTGREGLEGVPRPVGPVMFSSSVLPGWASPTGSFEEPIPPKKDGKELISFGPLPREWAKWRGLYVSGKQVVLSYTVGKASVLELPGYDETTHAFTRTFRIENSTAPLTLLVCESLPSPNVPQEFDTVLTRLIGEVQGKFETTDDHHLLLKLPPLGKAATFKLVIWGGPAADKPDLNLADSDLPDIKRLTKGGPPQWNPVLTTKGALGTNDTAYVVDTITLPDFDANPWHAWMRCSGFDFFKDARRAAMCTVNGDVWLVSGLDEKLDKITWKRFATGLFQPLGLKIVDENIYVRGRDQITRLHDLN